MKTHNLFFVKKFLGLAIIVITIVVTVVFVSFHLRTESLTEDILLQQGRALFSQLILTRRWISKHGGVFVKVKPGVDPNPYLTTLPNLKVNLTDEDGSLYTLRNPGLVVRGLSELAENSGQFSFHVASLQPVNRLTNSPDAFEKKALLAFKQGGEKEAFTIERGKEGSFYRYMAPLLFEEKCNKCHSSQNLTIGDIRGGISISISMKMVNEKLIANRAYTVSSAIVILGVLFVFLFVISRRLMSELNHAHSRLVLMATTDGLTELINRKVALERLAEEVSKHQRLQMPLSCMMIDIDHFKTTNDMYGHQAGDTVLRAIAGILKDNSRKYDIVCRYGGEEFMVVLPSTDRRAAGIVADKIRRIIAFRSVEYNNHAIRSTICAGVAQLKGRSENMDSFIKRADEALYRAKNSGRNRVEID